MTYERLMELVNDALVRNPIAPIKEYCKEYYSPYYMLLYLVAAEFAGEASSHSDGEKPLCVELGVESGRGSNAMLQSWCKVIGIDNNPDRAHVLAGNQNFTMLICSSHPVPNAVKQHGEKSILLLHVDTEHSESWAREEFTAYKPYLKDGAVVLFDDTNAMDGGVRRFVESLPYEKFFDDRLHESSGYGGIIYRENA